MKSLTLAFIIIGSMVVGGSVVYLCQRKTAPIPVTEPASKEVAQTPTDKMASPADAPPPSNIENTNTNPAAPLAVAAPGPDAPAAAAAKSALGKTIDALLDRKITADQKRALIQQLVKSGHADQAVAELKQRAIDNSNDAEIPTTLGELQLNQLRALHDAGGDLNDIGILAMQADQNFNAALKIDPQNWEAQFVKAASMTYWPADPTRDAGVVQQLSSLIDQQETMPSQAGFAQTYVMLGMEYQKMGQPDKAVATWQLGLAKFPNDPTLLQKLNGP
jgi:tetratricopeptide (TPR) repeat protein